MTTQRDIADQLGLPIHPPKVELFDLDARTNTDPKQRIRPVERYRRAPFGLYLARRFTDHPHLTYVRSWLLPDLGLRISEFDFVPGHELDQDYYLDIVDITTAPNQWRSLDCYLDISVVEGRHARLLDVDEFVVATQANLLDPATAQRAMRCAYAAVDGLARHHYVLADWLRHKGITLAWR